MATKFYLHDELNNVEGVLPTGKQTSTLLNYSLTGAATNRLMDIGIGTLQANLTGSSAALATVQNGLLGMWVSPAMNAGTVGGGSINFSIAGSESNAASNFWPNSLNIYVWRPSTGTKVGTIRDSTGNSLGGTEVGTSQTVVYISGITSSAVSMVAGDVIVVEVWSNITQSMGTSYTNNIFFDGTTESTTNGSASSNIASFIEFTEDVTSAPIVKSITGNSATGDVNSITFEKLGNTDLFSNASTLIPGTLSTGVGYSLLGNTGLTTISSLSTFTNISLPISGNTTTGSLGNESTTSIVSISSVGLTSIIGPISAAMLINRPLSGVFSNSALGSLSPLININLTGVTTNAAIGTLLGNPSANVSIVGTTSSLHTSSITRAAAILLSITGTSSTVIQGNETARITINISGVSSTNTVRSVSTGITGGIVTRVLTGTTNNSTVSSIAVLSITPPPYVPSDIQLLCPTKHSGFNVLIKSNSFNTTNIFFGIGTGSQKLKQFMPEVKSITFTVTKDRNVLLNL